MASLFLRKPEWLVRALRLQEPQLPNQLVTEAVLPTIDVLDRRPPFHDFTPLSFAATQDATVGEHSWAMIGLNDDPTIFSVAPKGAVLVVREIQAGSKDLEVRVIVQLFTPNTPGPPALANGATSGAHFRDARAGTNTDGFDYRAVMCSRGTSVSGGTAPILAELRTPPNDMAVWPHPIILTPGCRLAVRPSAPNWPICVTFVADLYVL